MLRLFSALVLIAGFVAVVFAAPVVLQAISASGAGSFPAPVVDQAVYDPAEAVSPEVERVLESQIDGIESRSGAEAVIYVRYDPTITPEANAADARRLIDEWGIGRAGYDDGFVILLTFNEPGYQHGELNTFAGSGFLNAYLPRDAQTALRDNVIVTAIRQGALEGGLVSALEIVDTAITPAATSRLEIFRTINALVGIPGAIVALFLTLGSVYVAWRRYGDDPELVDSPSVLMAGPPAGMTAPLATVIRGGRATQHSINTVLVDLAAKGLISFRNLDMVKKVKSDDDPNPLIDPAIDVVPETDAHAKQLPSAQREAYRALSASAIGGVLTRRRLWDLNDTLGPVRRRLEGEAVRLGWLTRRPSPVITRWVAIGIAEIVAGVGLVVLAYLLPMSGLTLVGAALGAGGIATVAFGGAMSQRTPQGAYVDAMLKAYRRTLKKTLEQARSMGEVVEQPEVRVLADTPDKAVVWGIALGLHEEVASVIERGMADPRVTEEQRPGYYPHWLGSSPGSGAYASSGAAATGGGLGGLFSGSGTPDIGGMFSSLGSMGSAPPSSSSSSGGGFSGGGSSGGGGGGSSF